LCVRVGVDELGVNPHAIAQNLKASLQNVRNAQVAPDLLYIPILAPVCCDATAANDLQISHLAEIGENVVLNAIGEIWLSIIVPQTFEGQNCDTFPSIRRWLHVCRLTGNLLRPSPKREQNSGQQNCHTGARDET